MSPNKDFTADFEVEEDQSRSRDDLVFSLMLFHPLQSPAALPTAAPLQETDPHRLAQRQKQLDLGKNTLGYQRYLETVPKKKRKPGNKKHPSTPDPYQVCSKRAFDGKLRSWRRILHEWDPRDPQQRRADAAAHCKRVRAECDQDMVESNQSPSPSSSKKARIKSPASKNKNIDDVMT